MLFLITSGMEEWDFEREREWEGKRGWGTKEGQGGGWKAAPGICHAPVVFRCFPRHFDCPRTHHQRDHLSLLSCEF